MMEVFRDEVNFESLLRDVMLKGYAFSPLVLCQEFLEAWNEEYKTLCFKPYDSEEGAKVFESHEVYRCRPFETEEYALSRRLTEEIGWRLRQVHVPGAATRLYYPNDVNVLRYSDTTKSIGKHRDYSTDRMLIAAFTMQGYSEIECFGVDEHNCKPQVWQSGPGSLMLLWGPGLSDGCDLRPYHRVLSPKYGQRVSCVVRMSEKQWIPPHELQGAQV